jgi:hypothetical protein
MAEIKTVIYLEDLGIVESSNIDEMNIKNENNNVNEYLNPTFSNTNEPIQKTNMHQMDPS